jgi:hypothetical protein
VHVDEPDVVVEADDVDPLAERRDPPGQRVAGDAEEAVQVLLIRRERPLGVQGRGLGVGEPRPEPQPDVLERARHEVPARDLRPRRVRAQRRAVRPEPPGHAHPRREHDVPHGREHISPGLGPHLLTRRAVVGRGQPLAESDPPRLDAGQRRLVADPRRARSPPVAGPAIATDAAAGSTVTAGAAWPKGQTRASPATTRGRAGLFLYNRQRRDERPPPRTTRAAAMATRSSAAAVTPTSATSTARPSAPA